MSQSFKVHEIPGPELGPWLDALGKLRIRVFREFPYLYEGTLEYERDYLSVYQKSDRARVAIVEDENGEVVGATTCLPMRDEGPEFQEPFLNAGIDLSRVFYLGESLLLPEWRGRGLGKLFFDLREKHARALGFSTTVFCAVDRPENHPLRPSEYRSLDQFWKGRGYEKRSELVARYLWKDLDERAESPKSLTFWTKTWTT